METELALFKETLNVNPFQYDGPELVDAWMEIGENTRVALSLKSIITPRTARQKVEREVVYYKAQNRKKLQK